MRYAPRQSRAGRGPLKNCGGETQRHHNRWRPPTGFPLRGRSRGVGHRADAAALLRRLKAAGSRAAEARAALVRDRRAAPLMEPLLPALMCAIQTWGAGTASLRVVHDEQSALTPWRVAEMGARLAAQPSGGHLESVHRATHERCGFQCRRWRVVAAGLCYAVTDDALTRPYPISRD